MKQILLGSLLILLVSGCGNPLGMNESLSVLSYRNESTSPLSPSTKIFLVAGGKDNANFAEEIVRQKKIWINAGFSSDEIACYYAIPHNREFWNDESQYRSLAGDLQNCYAASPKRVYAHLSNAVEQNPDFIYLYATSHGSKPLSEFAKDPGTSQKERSNILEVSRMIPALDQFFISLDVGPDDQSVNLEERFKAIADGRYKGHESLFTPHYLKSVLSSPKGQLIPKYVTIQGCYSGGFLDSTEARFRQQSLGDVPELTTITASQFDRTSFGCNDGAKETFFGSIYNDHLPNYVSDPNTMDWKTLYQSVAQGIKDLESKLLPNEPPSLPQFGTSRGVAPKREEQVTTPDGPLT
jgi:hypothetical protein